MEVTGVSVKTDVGEDVVECCCSRGHVFVLVWMILSYLFGSNENCEVTGCFENWILRVDAPA